MSRFTYFFLTPAPSHAASLNMLCRYAISAGFKALLSKESFIALKTCECSPRLLQGVADVTEESKKERRAICMRCHRTVIGQAISVKS